MMAGSLSTTTAAGLICTANPSAVAAWTAGWEAVFALLPDTFHVAFEPLNEPPNCAEGTTAWDAAQLSLYHQVRTLRRAIKFVVYGHHWGDNVGTDFTSLDPTPYRGDINVLFTFHYCDPFAFTGQGLSWGALPLFDWFDVALRYCQCAVGAGQRDNALGLVEQDPNLPPGQTATFENELTADIASYAVSGTPDYLTAQFAKVQTWARAKRGETLANPRWRIRGR